MKASSKKFIAVFKKNEKNITKVDLLTGWQLDSMLESKSYSQALDFICPVGSRYTPKEYSQFRKLH